MKGFVLNPVMIGFKRGGKYDTPIAWVSPRAKQPHIYFDPRYWKWIEPENPIDFDEIQQLPCVISHETIHLILQKISPYSEDEPINASHGLDNRDIFGYASADMSGIEGEILDDYLFRHIPIPLPERF